MARISQKVHHKMDIAGYVFHCKLAYWPARFRPKEATCLEPEVS